MKKCSSPPSRIDVSRADPARLGLISQLVGADQRSQNRQYGRLVDGAMFSSV
jgi:hypothetical protein